MRHRVIPLLAPLVKPRPIGSGCVETRARGLDVLQSPLLNKGSAFTLDERQALGLTGLLPPKVSTLETQVKQAYVQYERIPDALSQYTYLTALRDRNEVLFFRLLSEHLREMIPVLSGPTIGLAMQHHHHECRRPRGVYLSIDHPECIEAAFTNLGGSPSDIDLFLATDAEHIPGIGDAGGEGIEVAAGKLAILTAAGGIDPSRIVPVLLDTGTGRAGFLADPQYIGNRHPRIRGDRYDAFIDAYAHTVSRLFPHALLQWEDFAPANGHRILDQYRDRICTFSDGVQGTGAIALAAVISAARVCGMPLRQHRIVILGAGAAGTGIAGVLLQAMVGEGLSPADAARRFWCIDRQGLLLDSMAGRLLDHQVPYACPAQSGEGWQLDGDGCGPGLACVVSRVQPTMLIGASNSPGAFTEPIVRDMAAHAERPVILALSSPRHSAEANPADLLAWTDGRALIATGAAFSPVTYKGVTYVIAQASNAMLYPGLVLGAIVARSATLSDAMLAAAAGAVSSLVTVRPPGASLLPHLDDLRSVSVTVAVAVAEAALAEGLARTPLTDIAQQVQDAVWQPAYRRILAT